MKKSLVPVFVQVQARRVFVSKPFRRAAVGTGAVVAAAGASADYATDVQASFTAKLTELQGDAFAMFGDAIPFIIAVAGIGVLASLAVGMIKKMRA